MSELNLKELPFFESLNDEQLKLVDKYKKRYDYKEGEILFYQGDKAESYFYVLKGRINLFRHSMEGEEKVIEIVSEGQTFAEAVMFLQKPVYPVGASAIVDSTVLSFDSRHFLDLLHTAPDTSLSMLGKMSQRLHGMITEIDKLTLQNATYRLVTYLVKEFSAHEVGSQMVSLPIPKNVLASRLSIKPETLSRLLKKLTDEKLIRVENKSVQIMDMERLKERVHLE